MRGRAAAAVALALTVAPAAAHACASCIASAYGDRSFNWAYVVLIATPFALTVVVGAVIAYSSGYRLPGSGRRRPAADDGRERGLVPDDLDAHKETT